MHLLARFRLDGGQEHEPQRVRDSLHGGQIPGAVMVAHRDDIQAFYARHVDDVVGRHERVRARGQAGMYVQVGRELHFQASMPEAYMMPAI